MRFCRLTNRKSASDPKQTWSTEFIGLSTEISLRTGTNLLI